MGNKPYKFLGTDRYVIEEKVGAGAMGVVYRARDRERNEIVALKLLKESNALALYRFKREFRSLADVAHRNLVPLYELSSVDDHWFFTMKLIEGVDFLRFVRGVRQIFDDDHAIATATAQPPAEATATGMGGTGTMPTQASKLTGSNDWQWSTPTPTPTGSGALRAVRAGVRAPALASAESFERLRSAMTQLAVGIQALHRHGTLHRDIKPSNVMVDNDDCLMLLDFGVVSEIASRKSALDAELRVAGTPAYMAPEIGTDEEIAEASDWYSAGVMLYEALTGTRPYAGGVRAMLQLKRTADPPTPASLSPDVPADLDDLCHALLCRDQSKRASGSDILRVCGGGSVDHVQAAAVQVSDVALVGRDEELTIMNLRLDAARTGTPAAVLVHGPSGMGKSALVSHFCDAAVADGALLLAGRCFERESVPFKALDNLMDSVAGALLELPKRTVHAVLPRNILALARLFPVLRRVEAVLGGETEVLSVSDPHDQRRMAIAALRELLTGIAKRSPVIVHVDDLQWGDTDSAALLADVLRPPHAPPVLFIASYRDETEQVGPFVKRLQSSMQHWVDVPVRPLSAAQASQLAGSLLPTANARTKFAAAIAKESAGNPFFVCELARYVTTKSADELAGLELTLDELLHSRLVELSPSARALLDVIAVAGRPILQRVALRATQLRDPRAAVTELRNAHLVRTRGVGEDDPIEAFHDRIRETTYNRLTSRALRDCHLRVAYSMQASGTPDAEALGVHFERGGESERAGTHYIEAAALAAEQLAFDRCGHLYMHAIKLVKPTGDLRSELYERAADAYSNAGRGADAANAYLEAAEGAPRAISLRYRGRSCEELLRSGRVGEGVTSMRAVLTEVGLNMPQGRTGALMTVAWLRVRIRLRGLRYRERDASQITLADLTRIDVCWAAAMALGMSDHMLGTALQARHLLDALRLGERNHVARALALEEVFSSLSGKSNRRTEKVGIRVLALAEEIDDPLSNVWAKGARAFALYQRGDWPEALEMAKAALAHVHGKAGMWWERTSTNVYRLWAEYWLGEMGDLAERVPILLRDADMRGDLYSSTNYCIGFPAVAWLVRDDPDGWQQLAEQAMTRWSRDSYHLQHYWYTLARCHYFLYVGQARAAYDLIVEQWALMKKNLMLTVEMVLIESLHLRGRCAIAAAHDESENAASLLKAASRDARKLDRMRRPHAAAMALLLRAGIAAVNKSDDVMELLETAEAAALTVHMRLHAAIARRYRGLMLGGAEGEALARAADAELTEQTIVDTARWSRTFLTGFG